ncbi:MAG: twin-arginine translocase TatA/TatE family subunit [Chloroflexi bacterium]|nr:twin-arginine translocase TatA/TatE family subunit [Chloroflexota bacterium]
MFGRIGPPEVVLILVIILIVFGVGKLPQVGESIGKGLRAFRKAQSTDILEEEKPKEKPQVQEMSDNKAAKS